MGNNDTKLTPTNILNRSYDETYDTLAVVLSGEDSGNSVTRRVQVDATGALKIAGSVASAGTIADGVSSAIVATVKDLTNSNPLTVAIVDATGDQVSSFGGGTQYTEDAAAVTNPVAPALTLIRDDARSGGLTTTDGDNVAARGTNAGEIYVKHVDAIPVTSATFATAAKQLADNHQVTISNIASTPLVNITTLATSAKQLPDGHTVALSATDNAVLDAIDLNTDSGAVVGVGTAATAQRVHLSDEALAALENITVISSGTVTANAGTNLNTSALATEAGNLASIKAKTDNIPALGQALAAASVPVILPTATITTLTPPAAITGFSTETTLGTVHGHVDSIDTKTPALGQALAAVSVPVVLTAAQITTLTPPAQGLTDTQLRASAVPVSGTVTVNTGLTDTQLRATAVPVSVATIPSHAVTNAGTFAVQVTSAPTTAVTNLDLTTLAGAVSATHMQVDVLTAPTTAVTGTFYQATQPVSIATMPSTPVTGTFWQATQPVSLATLPVTNAGTFAVQSTEVDPTTVLHGKTTVTTAGTRVVLAASTACKSVTIKALTANTGIIYVGSTTVASTNGFALAAGETVSLDIANLTTVNIDSSVNGEGVTYIGIN